MIVFLSNADTERLALRVAIDSLPPDFPPVRAGNPDRLAAPPSLDAGSAVSVEISCEETCSPGSPRMAMGAPRGAVPPSGTRIRSTVPSA